MEYNLEDATEEWDACKNFYGDNYDESKKDWQFLHGDGQWDERDIKARKEQGRPALTLNQLLPYAQQIVNDIRQARMAVRVTPVDEDADKDTAEVLQGIIRNIENQSDASTAYSTAALNAVGAGIGWLRIRVDYADNTTFDQEIYIERVLDFTSVYIDPSSTALDGHDAEFGFIRMDYRKERFAELYPDAEPISFDDATTQSDYVCVVEYFRKYYKTDTLYQIRLIDGSIQVINGEQKQTLDDDGTVVYEELDSRKVDIPYVKHCILNGEENPISETEFPSDYIPLVPVIGEEVYIDDKREFHSLIRQAKDAQRMYNYYSTTSTELTAMQPKAPWIAPVGSFKSYGDDWANANNSNAPYLEYDVVHDKNDQRVEPPVRQQPFQGSAGMMQAAATAKEDIRLAIGMPQANMGERGNEVSGIAIRNRQVEGDNATFHFVDNLATSIQQIGRILVNMIPRLYSERKIARIMGEDDEVRNVPINQPFVKEGGQERAMSPNDKESTGIYDLGLGKYDVVCDVGAAYSSKRQETADKLIQLISAQPELASVTGDLLFKALDIPMGDQIADRLKSTMDPSILGEDPQAQKLIGMQKAMQQMEDQLKNYQAALEDKEKDKGFEQSVKLKELSMEQERVMIDARKTAADIEKMRAETKNFNADAVNKMAQMVAKVTEDFGDISGAMEIMLDAKEAEANQATAEPVNEAKTEIIE